MFVCSRLWKLVLTLTLLKSSSTFSPTSSKHFLAIIDFGVVVAGGEIVEAGFGIVVVTAIAERVVCAKRSCQGAGGGYQLAPRIVDIFYHTHAAFVHKAHYIILAVYKSRGSWLINCTYRAKCIVDSAYDSVMAFDLHIPACR